MAAKRLESNEEILEKGYNAYIGNDIKKIKNPKSKWYQKAGATVSVASNFIPGAGQAKWAAKGAISAVKYGKKAKKVKKFKAAPLKKERKQKSKPKPLKLDLKFFSSNKKGGRLGNDATRDQNRGIGDILESRGWRVTNGGGRAKEEYLPGPNRQRKGSNWVDITAKKGGKTLRINTVDMRKNGQMTNESEKQLIK
ncbi:hypothetical protein ABIE66_002970 [Peribacillus sp. B2I2]|uniref:hypothetical protein n=1 Tax=Peribacillus sp. B2I2 TaxID=3156468 RepID=UPI0035141481